MLTPLFSYGCELVGWMLPQKFLFDAEMAYVAFITNGHAWSARSGQWIGPVVGSHVFDVDGRPVAWNPAAPLRGFGRPLRPVNVVRAVSPVRPARPVSPLRPLTAPDLPGGWSQFSYAEWLVSSDPKPVEIVEEVVVVETVDEVAVVAVVAVDAGEADVRDGSEAPDHGVK
ncbi:4-fold beta flower protein [Mesorhizobium sp. ASY16-5R]|uniref:4-fold beta flower protein n=1 Tax=Mesorhizobium sp. ASY16-5R TaxID=3445772 RepID=UPI003F9FC493